ncbi:MAG: DUF4386 domain-containing protein [Vicinamibacteria bacterium]
MTRTGNSRLAGTTFLLYIATGIGSMYMMSQVTAGAEGAAARFAAIAEHEMAHRVNVLLTLLQAACAVILGVTLYALTRDEDRELALLGLCSRFTEGVIAVVSTVNGLALLRLATASRGATGADTSVQGLESLLKQADGATFLIGGTCFAIGSTLFCYLLLRARTVPVSLAWVGLIASVLLVIGLPLRILGIVQDGMTIWMPMLVFEIWFAFWLIFKGVAAPQARSMRTA